MVLEIICVILEKKSRDVYVTFISACVSVCGDDTCELEENCLTCPADCGVCPMPTSIKVAIGLPVALFCSGFFLTLVVRMLVQCLTNICSCKRPSQYNLQITYTERRNR